MIDLYRYDTDLCDKPTDDPASCSVATCESVEWAEYLLALYQFAEIKRIGEPTGIEVAWKFVEMKRAALGGDGDG